MKHLGNLRIMPQLSEGFNVAYLVGLICTHELVWAPESRFGILHNQEPICDSESLPGKS